MFIPYSDGSALELTFMCTADVDFFQPKLSEGKPKLSAEGKPLYSVRNLVLTDPRTGSPVNSVYLSVTDQLSKPMKKGTEYVLAGPGFLNTWSIQGNDGASIEGTGFREARSAAPAQSPFAGNNNNNAGNGMKKE